MQSEFTGSTLKYILFTIAAGLVSSLTFGLAFPIMFFVGLKNLKPKIPSLVGGV